MDNALGPPTTDARSSRPAGPPAVVHGRPPPVVRTDAQGGVRMDYIDDWSGVVLGVNKHEARKRAQGRLDSGRRALRARCLGSHKEQLAQFLTVLGGGLDAEDRRLVPDAQKLRELMAATQGVLRVGSVRPDALERIVGKWSAFILMRRELFACLRWVYVWLRAARDARSERTAQPVPVRVQRELRMLLHLAPMLTAELHWDVCPEVSMVDGGPGGLGVVVARPPSELIRRECREGHGNGWWRAGCVDPSKLDNPGVVVEPPPPVSPELLAKDVKWRVAVCAKAPDAEHNNVTETRAYAVALRRLTRNRQFRGQRVLIATDSFVCMGVMGKGRSSSAPLLYQAQRAAAHALFSDLRICRRYVPSEWSLADWASRKKARVGVAPDTAAKASARGRPHIDVLRSPALAPRA